MEEKSLGGSRDAIEILTLNTDELLYEIKEKLDVYDLSLSISNTWFEALLCDVLKVEEEEVENPEVTRGCVYVRREGTGRYVSIKNCKFFLIDLLEGAFNLAQAKGKGRIIVGAIFLLRIMQKIGYALSEEQTMSYVVLYQLSKKYVITDENILQYVNRELKENNYYMPQDKINKAFSELIEIGLVVIENGRYEVTEKLVVE